MKQYQEPTLQWVMLSSADVLTASNQLPEIDWGLYGAEQANIME